MSFRSSLRPRSRLRSAVSSVLERPPPISLAESAPPRSVVDSEGVSGNLFFIAAHGHHFRRIHDELRSTPASTSGIGPVTEHATGRGGVHRPLWWRQRSVFFSPFAGRRSEDARRRAVAWTSSAITETTTLSHADDTKFQHEQHHHQPHQQRSEPHRWVAASSLATTTKRSVLSERKRRSSLHVCCSSSSVGPVPRSGHRHRRRGF